MTDPAKPVNETICQENWDGSKAVVFSLRDLDTLDGDALDALVSADVVQDDRPMVAREVGNNVARDYLIQQIITLKQYNGGQRQDLHRAREEVQRIEKNMAENNRQARALADAAVALQGKTKKVTVPQPAPEDNRVSKTAWCGAKHVHPGHGVVITPEGGHSGNIYCAGSLFDWARKDCDSPEVHEPHARFIGAARYHCHGRS